MSECPICVATISTASNTLAGELLDCRACGSELEVVRAQPLILREAPTEAEDWGE